MSDDTEYSKLKKKVLRRKEQSKAAAEKEKQAIENRGIPKWYDSDGYPLWQKLNKHQQKWEFLRRSPDYTKDWARYSAAEQKKKQAVLGKYLAANYGLKKLVDPKTSGQNFKEHFFNHAAKGCDIYPIIEESESFLISMGLASPQPVDKEMEELAERMGAARRDPYGLFVTVRFNLEFPAKEQANFVADRLKEMQKVRKKLMAMLKLPKGQKYEEDDYCPIEIREQNRAGNKKARDKNIGEENHILLLRILDAASCGLKHEDIAAGLTEHEILTGETWDASTISRKLTRAKNLWRQM